MDRPTDNPPIPPTVHWAEWIGPAEMRPYSPLYHNFKWRGWWEFGTGALGDMACHTMNLPFMALDLREPTAVEAESSGHNKETYPRWSVIRYTFPARGKRPALTMTWYDGGKRPSAELLDGQGPAKSVSLIVGSKGKLYAGGDSGGGYKLLGDVKEPEVESPQSPG